MSGKTIRNRAIGAKSLAAAVLAVTTALGACVSVVPGGGGGGGGPQPNPGPGPVPQPVADLACQQRVGNNGGRGFWDIGLGQCWSCPAGSNRTVFDVRGSDACQIGGIFGSMVSAEYLGT